MLVQSVGPTILLLLAENHGQSNIWYGYNRFMYAAIRPLLREKKHHIHGQRVDYRF